MRNLALSWERMQTLHSEILEEDPAAIIGSFPDRATEWIGACHPARKRLHTILTKQRSGVRGVRLFGRVTWFRNLRGFAHRRIGHWVNLSIHLIMTDSGRTAGGWVGRGFCVEGNRGLVDRWTGWSGILWIAEPPNGRTTERFLEGSVLVRQSHLETVLVEIFRRVGGVASGEDVAKS